MHVLSWRHMVRTMRIATLCVVEWCTSVSRVIVILPELSTLATQRVVLRRSQKDIVFHGLILGQVLTAQISLILGVHHGTQLRGGAAFPRARTLCHMLKEAVKTKLILVGRIPFGSDGFLPNQGHHLLKGSIHIHGVRVGQ